MLQKRICASFLQRARKSTFIKSVFCMSAPALLPCDWIKTVPDCLGGKSALRTMWSCREWKTTKEGGLEGTRCDMVDCKEDDRDFVDSWCGTVEACVKQEGNGSDSQRGKVEVDIKWYCAFIAAVLYFYLPVVHIKYDPEDISKL